MIQSEIALSPHLLPLFPASSQAVPLRGLYLSLRLHREAVGDRPLVYANFLSSLDGRIAIKSLGETHSRVPKTMTSVNDFRLLQELEAQADCVVTHGGYLRALAEGRLGNVLQIGLPEDSQDLADWRRQQGLAPQPAIVVASASLDFPVADKLRVADQAWIIATGARAAPNRIAQWRDRGFEVVVAGEGQGVDGRPLVSAITRLGFRSVYLSAGPRMLSTMLRDGQLSKLFMTTTHQLMGGEAPITMLTGAPLTANQRLKLRSLYYDPSSPDGTGQFFAQYDTLHSSAGSA